MEVIFLMKYEELIEKAKQDENLELYETLIKYKSERDNEAKESNEKITKLQSDGEAKDAEIQKLKDKTWELLESGARIYSEQRKAQEEKKPISAADIIKTWGK